ncbi:hypothetical protein F5X97DRAFT_333341 [Nemania serpens]|nr:hypothetical protein F5X97DRAFT_333341 [Nemania serpens]
MNPMQHTPQSLCQFPNVYTTSLTAEHGYIQRSCLASSILDMAVPPIRGELNSLTPTPPYTNKAIYRHPSEPGPATGGRFYEEDKQRPSIFFKFCPDTSRLWNLTRQDWIACLMVKCSDVPRLMREGFHLDACNVIKEEGYIEGENKSSNQSSRTSTVTRWYFLADTHQPRRWIASMEVRALNPHTLYNFNLSRLSREVIRSAWAMNQREELIYEYRAYTFRDKYFNAVESPVIGFNIIYDRMPMEGLWPWPRKEKEDEGCL